MNITAVKKTAKGLALTIDAPTFVLTTFSLFFSLFYVLPLSAVSLEQNLGFRGGFLTIFDVFDEAPTKFSLTTILSKFLSISSCSTCDGVFCLSSCPSSYLCRRRRRLYRSCLSSSRPTGCLSSSLFVCARRGFYRRRESSWRRWRRPTLGPYQRWRSAEARFLEVVLVAFCEFLRSLYPLCMCVCACVSKRIFTIRQLVLSR